MRLVFAVLICLAASPAYALRCAARTHLLTPFETVDQRPFVVASATYGHQIDALMKAKPHFVDRDGTPVPALLTRHGTQLVLRPSRGLKGSARLVAPGWPTKTWSVVERDAIAPAWRADPVVVEADERAMGRYGMRWRRIIQAPIAHATLVEMRFKGTELVRYATVKDGKIALYGGPCGYTLGPIKPGTYTVEARPVSAAGALGPAKAFTLTIPKR